MNTTAQRPADYRGMWISVYQPISGWKAIQYWWNPEMRGFWEPYQSGMCGYETKDEAVAEAKYWAESEELPYYED